MLNNFWHVCRSIGSCHALKTSHISDIGSRNNILFRHYFASSYNSNVRQRQCILFKSNLSINISQKCFIHPFIWMVLKPVAKAIAVLSGRGFRKWWKDLPLKKREYFYQTFKKNRLKIAGVTFVSGGLVLVYYWSHIQETPITKRKRFVAFTPEQFQQIADFEFETQKELHEHDILPTTHPDTQKVSKVAFRLLKGNTDIPEIYGKKWSVTVVNSSVQNAFVLPNGQVFMFSGMLQLCSNEDQLGMILAHEMAHCILGHGAEQVSFVHLLDFFVIVILAAIWAILPSDGIAIITQWFFHRVTELLLHFPYNRKLETEADEVGLQLAAKACFDVRESSAFWGKMALAHKENLSPETEWLFTHPSHETRSQVLDSLMEKALELRLSCGCPKLTKPDPRALLSLWRQQIEQKKKDVSLKS